MSEQLLVHLFDDTHKTKLVQSFAFFTYVINTGDAQTYPTCDVSYQEAAATLSPLVPVSDTVEEPTSFFMDVKEHFSFLSS